MDITLWSCGLHVIPVQLQGDSSISFQLLRKFLLSFKLVFTSNSVRPREKERETIKKTPKQTRLHGLTN